MTMGDFHVVKSSAAANRVAVCGAMVLLATISVPMHVATQPRQGVDRSKAPTVEASAGGFTVRRLISPVAIDGRNWIAVPPLNARQTVRAPNGQFTLTLEEASNNDTVRFRIYFAEAGGARVELDPGGAVYVSITSDSRWIFIDPIDVVDVRTWRRYSLSKLFNIGRYVSIAISADGRRLFVSRQPCPFDCQGIPNEYFEIRFPAA